MAGNGADVGITLFEHGFERRARMFDGGKSVPPAGGCPLASDMATDQLIRLFAEENRVRAFAAVALGAETSERVAEVAGLTPRARPSPCCGCANRAW